MAIERPDYTHAAGSFHPTLPDPVVTQSGFDSFVRNGVGNYTATCTERIAFGECIVFTEAGPNELRCVGGQVIAPGTVEIRAYDTFGNPADCVLLIVEIKQVTTGPALDGVLPPPPVPIVPPAPPVLSVFGRVGNVVAVAGDYTSSLITNLSGVVGATVTDALNTLAAAIASLAAAVASLVASVATAIDYIEGLAATRYQGAVDPFGGASQCTLSVLVSPEVFNGGAFQTLAGNNAGAGGGFGISLFGNSLLVQCWDSGGVERTEFVNIPATRRWLLITALVDTTTANMVISIWINGSQVFANVIALAGGALPAGGTFTIGSRPGGGNPCPSMRIQGAGWAARIASAQELADQWTQSIALGMLADLSGGYGAAYRIDGADPGAAWVPFVGAGNLTRTGVATTYAVDPLPMWWS